MPTVKEQTEDRTKEYQIPFWVGENRGGVPYELLRFYPCIRHGHAVRICDVIKHHVDHGFWVDSEVPPPPGAPVVFKIDTLKEAYRISADTDVPIIEGIIQAVGEEHLPNSWISQARAEAPLVYADPATCGTRDIEEPVDPDAERRKALLDKVTKAKKAKGKEE